MELRGTMAWSEPLLSGEEAAAARELVREIADAVLAARGALSASAGGLTSGAEGSAMFLFEAARALGDEGLRAEADAWLAAAHESFLARPSSPWLFEGAAGVAFALEVGARHEDAVRLRQRLLPVTQALRASAPLELAYGLAGIGLAALAAEDESAGALVLVVVDAIVARPATDHEWKMDDPTAGLPGAPCTGVAHGVAGVLSFLAAALDAGVSEAEAPLREGVAFLRAHRRTGGGSAYAMRLDAKGPSARSAYCHGDPGIGLALLRAGRALEDDTLAHEAVALLVGDAARSRAETKVQDAGFCHGAAGLGHLLHHAWRATAVVSLREAARRWFGEVLATPRRGDVFQDFLAYEPVPGGVPRRSEDHTLLSGVPGVGAALASAIAVGPPSWDAAFLGPWLR